MAKKVLIQDYKRKEDALKHVLKLRNSGKGHVFMEEIPVLKTGTYHSIQRKDWRKLQMRYGVYAYEK